MGERFRFGDKLSFQDLDGNELAFTGQKLALPGESTYEIWRNGDLSAVVKKKVFTFMHCQFSVDVPGPDDLEARGDLLDLEYAFTRGPKTVASVSKRFFALNDTYGIDIASGEDDVLILASAVVIDLACHPDGKRHH